MRRRFLRPAPCRTAAQLAGGDRHASASRGAGGRTRSTNRPDERLGRGAMRDRNLSGAVAGVVSGSAGGRAVVEQTDECDCGIGRWASGASNVAMARSPTQSKPSVPTVAPADGTADCWCRRRGRAGCMSRPSVSSRQARSVSHRVIMSGTAAASRAVTPGQSRQRSRELHEHRQCRINW